MAKVKSKRRHERDDTRKLRLEKTTNREDTRTARRPNTITEKFTISNITKPIHLMKEEPDSTHQ